MEVHLYGCRRCSHAGKSSTKRLGFLRIYRKQLISPSLRLFLFIVTSHGTVTDCPKSGHYFSSTFLSRPCGSTTHLYLCQSRSLAGNKVSHGYGLGVGPGTRKQSASGVNHLESAVPAFIAPRSAFGKITFITERGGRSSRLRVIPSQVPRFQDHGRNYRFTISPSASTLRALVLNRCLLRFRIKVQQRILCIHNGALCFLPFR